MGEDVSLSIRPAQTAASRRYQARLARMMNARSNSSQMARINKRDRNRFIGIIILCRVGQAYSRRPTEPKAWWVASARLTHPTPYGSA